VHITFIGPINVLFYVKHNSIQPEGLHAIVVTAASVMFHPQQRSERRCRCAGVLLNSEARIPSLYLEDKWMLEIGGTDFRKLTGLHFLIFLVFSRNATAQNVECWPRILKERIYLEDLAEDGRYMV
jgi:hypothetical protein